MKRPVSLLNCFLIPILTLLLGIILGGIYAFQSIPKAYKDDARAVIPPKFTYSFQTPGRYSLWAYSAATFEGTEYPAADSLPTGSKIHVIDSKSGDFLPVNDWVPQTKKRKGESAFLVGTFETGLPNQEIDFIGSGIPEKMVIGISSKNMADMINVYLGIFGIFILSLFAAITILVVMLHRRKKSLLSEGAV
ncbi:MAG: hypothetical protein P1V20_09355 [Verrucomicrobiales bacterium]|nr:hypothetical protein [Verrucomicrobiales bacterium]